LRPIEENKIWGIREGNEAVMRELLKAAEEFAKKSNMLAENDQSLRELGGFSALVLDSCRD